MIFRKIMFTLKQACLRKTLFMLLMLSLVNTSHALDLELNPYAFRLKDWSATLTRFVDDQGRVDFDELANDTTQLQRFVDAIAKVSPASHPELFSSKSEVLAYHINSYNALAMMGVIERGLPDDFHSLFKRASFFRFRSVVIGGKKTNLYDYENSVIRPLGEPRVHFALNCMVVDCPRLPTKVFQAESLEADLQSAALEFFNKPKHIKIYPNSKTIYLSKIMDFYTQDYVASGDKNDLITYVNRYRYDAVPLDYRVKFMDYDWTVNQAPDPQLSRQRDLKFKSKITKIAG